MELGFRKGKILRNLIKDINPDTEIQLIKQEKAVEKNTNHRFGCYIFHAWISFSINSHTLGVLNLLNNL